MKDSFNRPPETIEQATDQDQPQPGEKCIWEEDEDANWKTLCGHTFTLNEGTPINNHMRFCCYCGLPLLQTRYKSTQ